MDALSNCLSHLFNEVPNPSVICGLSLSGLLVYEDNGSSFKGSVIYDSYTLTVISLHAESDEHQILQVSTFEYSG